MWVGVLWATVLIAYRDTAWSIVDTWIQYETYSHGFLILPISLWLIWERREHLWSYTPTTSLLSLVAALGAGLIWFAASLAYVQAAQQFALVALLIALTWFSIGNRAAWELAFPLGYLFFAVPVGEVLVPPLMELTATQTVELVRLTGVPVFREGLYFSLPTGNWSVVKACSGVRYLIASMALGTIYAYLTYQSLGRRLLFVAAAFVVPIIANVLRAYMIVMLGHWSDMKIATGVDHLIYGWIFFGLVMLLLFWVGSWFAESELKGSNTDVGAEERSSHCDMPAAVSFGRILMPVPILILSLALPSLLAAREGRVVDVPTQEMLIIGLDPEWSLVDQPTWSWRPPMNGADKQAHVFFARQERIYGVSIGLYFKQEQGAEMISFENGLIPDELDTWKVLSQGEATVSASGRSMDVSSAIISGDGSTLELLSWYEIGTLRTANGYIAKLKELIDKLMFNNTVSARIFLYSEAADGVAQREVGLQEFLNEVIQPVESMLTDLTGETY